MGNVSAISSSQGVLTQSTSTTTTSDKSATKSILGDSVTLSKGKVSSNQAMGMVYESAMAKLRAVVDDARSALGLKEGDVLDTTPEATAGRIADFALGAFESWKKNHKGLAEEDARTQFSQFIGGAIQEGISQARGILTSLSALTPDVNNNIDSTWQIIQKRLDEFVKGTDTTQQTSAKNNGTAATVLQ